MSINQYTTETGTTANAQTVTTLYKTHWHDGTPLVERIYIKAWYDCNEAEIGDNILKEIELNDWSRWNTELKKDNDLEVSEAIYYNMLECLPPKNWKGSYFEVGEAHHHDNNGKAIHRAFWMENGKYYTGYPKQIAHLQNIQL